MAQLSNILIPSLIFYIAAMGLSQKNMYVVPNNIVGQWKDIFLTMYPQAELLCVEPKSFVPSKRQAVLERIRDEDFDGIIITCSCFEQIPPSELSPSTSSSASAFFIAFSRAFSLEVAFPISSIAWEICSFCFSRDWMR